MTWSVPSSPPLGGALLSAMVESLQDYAILVLDVEGRITSWNVGSETFEGWHAEDIFGFGHEIFYAPLDRAGGRPQAELRAAADEGHFEDQHWRVRRDGSRFWANVVITAVRDAAGELSGYGVVIRDVSDHYAAVQRLRQSEARLRSVTESAPDAIISTDSAGRIISWNRAAARLYGYASAEAIGRSASMLVPARHRAEAKGRVATAILEWTSGEARPMEGVACRADGTELPIELSIGSWEVGGERNFTGIVRDITERKDAERRLRHLADHDSLTGLFNRRRFASELERIVSEAGRYGRRAALLVLDLDGFKEVNDRHGHAVGDEVLAKVGELLTGIVRGSDVVGRLGGDEFGVIVQEADRAEAQVLAGKIIDAVRGRAMVVSDRVRPHLSASVGITLLEPEGAPSAGELMVEADRAMYCAKDEGHGAYAIHVPHELSTAGEEPPSWLERLGRALEEHRFELHAQPIVAINGSGVPRYELLVRLREENGELLAPATFLESAERCDLIGGIDRWVLGEAVRILHDHHTSGADISLTVNLSGKTMNDPGIAEDLRALLEDRPIPQGSLIVEVTETAAIVNPVRSAALARELRELGCDFGLDHFGSGVASLSHLKHLDFDYLKIDGELVTHLLENPADQLAVRAVVDIARGLGSRTIAEFVGDEDTRSMLFELGVDFGQGFHLGRPAPLDERLPVTG